MNKNEIRIKLKYGTAVVDRNIKPETIEALNNMVTLAYEQIKSGKLK